MLLGLLAVYYAFRLRLINNYKAAIWRWAFGLLAAASFLGVIAHGLDLAEATRDLIWKPLNLMLGLTLGVFVVGAVYDLAGEKTARRTLPFMIITGLLFFGVTMLVPGTFLTFIAYEAVAVLFALGVYAYLAFNKGLVGAPWLAGGVLVTLAAAVVQATGQAGNAIFWSFDNNGVFHLIQMAGLVLLSTGINQGLPPIGGRRPPAGAR